MLLAYISQPLRINANTRGLLCLLFLVWKRFPCLKNLKQTIVCFHFFLMFCMCCQFFFFFFMFTSKNVIDPSVK